MKINLTLFIFLLFLFSCQEDEIEKEQNGLTETEKQLVDELNQLITPLYGSSPTLDNSDIEVFGEFGNATIIGLGEATHGTKEFFQMKHRLFKYFVENHGFRIFGFEADMGECIYINRFITKGIGTVEDVMNKMHFWTWKTEEVKELILWMREYNTGKPEEEWIHFLGVDCQFATYNQTLIAEYLNTYDINYPEHINQALNQITLLNNEKEFTQNLTYAEALLKCDSLKMFFDNNKQEFTLKSGVFEYNLMVGLIDQTKHFVNYTFSGTRRDYGMAENSLWLTTLFENKAKVVLWAHNVHLAKDPTYIESSQGYYLHQHIGAKYKVIGFSFSKGSFQAVSYDATLEQYTVLRPHNMSNLPKRDSYNYIFSWTNPEDFILVHSEFSKSGALYDWYNSENSFITIGSVFSQDIYKYYKTYNLITRFDAIIHFHETNSAVGI